MTRKLLIAGGVLVVILVAAGVFLGRNLDSIVKKAITKIGPEITGVSVDVDKVGLALAEGRGEIGGLVIGNPSGYRGPHAFSLGSIVLALDRTAETADVVVIRELTIDAPDIAFDKGEDGSNIEAIQQSVNAYAQAHSGGTDQAAEAEEADASKRFIIESLQIRNGKIQLTGRDRVVDLPPVSLRDLGKSQGGMTGGEIASVVLKQMIDATVDTAKRALAEEGKERVKEEVREEAKGKGKGKGGRRKRGR